MEPLTETVIQALAQVDIVRKPVVESHVVLRLDAQLPTGPEGYTLEITPQRIMITGQTLRGLFYGSQTLRQLLGAKPAKEIPCLLIQDEPRFAWRGAMLDVARHFFTVAEIKKFLDLLALHKLNVFHWHLLEDQGWRIEIKKYPRLTEIGAWRSSGEEGSAPYGGFYTQEEIRDVVAYAAERFITVVPEIELPGHSSAAIAAYPFLGNDDIAEFAPKVQTERGVFPYIYAPKETTFDFLRDVLTEVMDLFPGPYIHIGGDEAPKEQWKQSPFAQEVIRREHLQGEEALQSWFISRIESFLNANGRRLIGWDEIQEGGLSSSATMMVWRDLKWAAQALAQGNGVILAPTTHCYLDYQQDDSPSIFPKLPLEKVYSFEPMLEGLTSIQQQNILGTQGNLWTETMETFAEVERMAFPRLCALAEVAWSPGSSRNYQDFLQRLEPHLSLLRSLDVNHFENGKSWAS